MRPFETLLLLANLITFFATTIPLPRAARWIRHSALIAPIVAAAQMLVEGIRWQMIPAYVLSGIFFVAGLRQRRKPVSAVVERS